MTMVTVPLAVLIGLSLGLIFAGTAAASDDGDYAAYVITAVLSVGLCILVASGLEALIKARGT